MYEGKAGRLRPCGRGDRPVSAQFRVNVSTPSRRRLVSANSLAGASYGWRPVHHAGKLPPFGAFPFSEKTRQKFPPSHEGYSILATLEQVIEQRIAQQPVHLALNFLAAFQPHHDHFTML